MQKLRVIAVLAASSALAFGAAPALAAAVSDADIEIAELPAEDGAAITYEDAVEGGGGTGEEFVKDDLGGVDEDVAVRDDDPLPGGEELMFHTTGGPEGDDFGEAAADDAAEAAADNAADKALERAEAAASSRTPVNAD